jgi:hypothetical protein
MALEPLFGYIGDEISKNWKRTLGLNSQQIWCSTEFALSFPERFQPITATAIYTVAIMFSSLVHLMLSQHPSLVKFLDFADNCQEGMKHQMRVQLSPNRA